MVLSWGVALLLSGLGLVVIELAYPKRYVGVLGVGLCGAGLAAMVVGTLDPATWMLVGGVGALVALLSIPLYRRNMPAVGPAHVPQVNPGDPVLVLETIEPAKEGRVRAAGLEWSARAPQRIEAGANARVTDVDGSRLVVEPLDSAPAPQRGRREDGEDADEG